MPRSEYLQRVTHSKSSHRQSSEATACSQQPPASSSNELSDAGQLESRAKLPGSNATSPRNPSQACDGLPHPDSAREHEYTDPNCASQAGEDWTRDIHHHTATHERVLHSVPQTPNCCSHLDLGDSFCSHSRLPSEFASPCRFRHHVWTGSRGEGQ